MANATPVPMPKIERFKTGHAILAACLPYYIANPKSKYVLLDMWVEEADWLGKGRFCYVVRDGDLNPEYPVCTQINHGFKVYPDKDDYEDQWDLDDWAYTHAVLWNATTSRWEID